MQFRSRCDRFLRDLGFCLSRTSLLTVHFETPHAKDVKRIGEFKSVLCAVGSSCLLSSSKNIFTWARTILAVRPRLGRPTLPLQFTPTVGYGFSSGALSRSAVTVRMRSQRSHRCRRRNRTMLVNNMNTIQGKLPLRKLTSRTTEPCTELTFALFAAGLTFELFVVERST